MKLRTLSNWIFPKPRTVRRKNAAHQLGSALELLEARITPAIRTWTGGGADDLWSNAANWDTGVPADNDDVRIAATPASAEVLFDSSVAGAGITIRSLTSNGTNPVGEPFRITGDTLTLAGPGPFAFGSTLTMEGGTIDRSADFSVLGSFTWSNGTMKGSGVTTVGNSATFTLNSANNKILDHRTLTNNGAATLSGVEFNGLVLMNGALFDNNGTFEAIDNSDIRDGGGGGGTFRNDGTFIKSTGGTTSIVLPFINNNVVNVTGGVLELLGGSSTAGTFTVSSGSSLFFSSDYTVDANSSIGGAGSVQFLGGIVTVNGSYTITGATTISNTTTFNAPTTFPTLNLSGTLGGNGNILIGSALNWASGTIKGVGTFTVPNTATLTLSTAGGKILDKRTLTNDGTATMSGGDLNLANAALFDNNGTFNATDAADMRDGGGAGTFRNDGTFIKTGAGTATSIVIGFANNGTVNVASGLLEFAGVFSNFSSATSTLSGGTFLVTDELRFENANIVTNAATIVLDGTASRIVDRSGVDALAHFGKNAATGSFTIQNGRNFTPSVAFTNAGNVFIGGAGANSTFSLTNGGTSTGDWDIAATGALLFSGTTASYLLDSGTDITGDGVANVTIGSNPVNVGDAASDVVNINNLTINEGAVNDVGALHITNALVLGTNNDNASLQGTGEVTIDGLFTWHAGTMSGTGHTIANGGILLSGGVHLKDGRQFDNNGTVTWTGVAFDFQNGAVFNNNGTFDIQVNSGIGAGSGAASVFNNNGIFKKTAGSDAAGISVPFNNNGGTVDVQVGKLTFRGGGTSTGPWTVAAPATLEFAGGDWNLNAGSTVSGPGRCLFESIGNVINLAGSYTVDHTEFPFDGAVNFNANSSTRTLELPTGTLGGSGDFTVSDSLTWGSGRMTGPGTTVVNGDLTLNSGFPSLIGRRVDNNGTATWTGNSLSFSNGAVFNNNGTFDDQVDNSINDGGGAQSHFNNNGTFRKSVLSGTTNILVAFTNNGAIDVQTGKLSLNGPSGGLTNFPIASTATIEPTGATESGTTVTITTSGHQFLVVGQTVTISGVAEAGYNGTFTVTAVPSQSAFQYTATTSGLPNSGGGSATFLSTSTLTGGTYLISGTLQFDGANIVTNAANIVLNGPASAFLNRSTGTDALANFATNAAAGSFTIQNGRNFTSTGPFSNAGSITVDPSSTFTVGAGQSYVQTGGNTTVNGTFTAANINIQDGLLQGGGTVTGNVTNAGLVGPGTSPGVLTVNGNYTQTNGGGLNIEIGGLTEGSQFDQLRISGAINLDGSLNISLTGGFVPAIGDTFRILDNTGGAPINGAFSGFAEGDFRIVGGATAFRISYAAGSGNDIVLTAVNVAPVLANLETSPLGFTENQAPIHVTNALSVTDVNDANLVSATVAISAGFNSTQDVLTFDTVGTSITGSYDSSTGVLSFSGRDTLAHFQAVLRSVKYANASDDPTGADRVITFQVDDGQAENHASNLLSRTIKVTPINDAPTFDAIPDPAAIFEDAGTQTISLSGISTGGEAQILTLTATSSNPGLIPNPAVTYTSPNATGSISYTPVANQSGSAVITVTVTDDGGTANGGANDFSRSFTVTVTAVNDVPTLDSISDPAAILEDAGTQTINLSGISAGPSQSQALTVTAVSSNPGLIPNPTVTYTSPNATGSLSYAPVSNQSGSAVITVTVTDNGGTANGGITTITRTFTVNVTAVNDAPTLDSIGDPLPILEDDGTQTINLGGISAGGGESQTLTVIATSSNPGLIPDPTVTYTSPNATGSLSYAPTGTQAGTAVITVTVSDDGGTANGGVNTFSRTFTVTVSPVNDSLVTSVKPLPVITAPSFTVSWTGTDGSGGSQLAALDILVSTDGGAFALFQQNTTATSAVFAGELGKHYEFFSVGIDQTGGRERRPLTADAQTSTALFQRNLPPIAEDTKNPAGVSISTLLGSAFSDADAGTLRGVAITGASGGGVWQFSADGKTFKPLIAPSEDAAWLLPDSFQVRFLPAANFTGNAGLVFRGWDRTRGAAGTQTAVPVNESASPFSAAGGFAQVQVTPVNDRPVLSTTPAPLLLPTPRSPAVPAGQLVASLVRSATDVDGNLLGAAVMGLAGKGVWEFSLDAGTTWANVGVVSGTSALLLGPTDLVRFTAAAGATGQATLTVKAWDQTSGLHGNRVNTTLATATAFSTASVAAATKINGAPVLFGAAPILTMLEDQAPNNGFAVSTLLTGRFTDDTGALQGVAITGADDLGHGQWQYSTDGKTFRAFGSLSDTAALLLRSTDKIRFLPNADFNGSNAAAFTFKAWDQTFGARGTLADVSAFFTGAFFSNASLAANLNITPVADRPVLDIRVTPALDSFLPGGAPSTAKVADLLGNRVHDADHLATGIAVTAVAGSGTWEFSLDSGATFSAMGAVSASSGRLLNGDARIRFVPNATFRGVASIKYKIWDETVGTVGSLSAIAAASTAFSKEIGTATVAVNTAPVLNAVVSPALAPVQEDTKNPAGFSVSALLGTAFSDADGAKVPQGIAVTGLTNVADGIWQFSTNGGGKFSPVGVVSDTLALLLRSTDKLRFLPGANFHGLAAATYRAWDQTSGVFGTRGDASSNGGSSAFSTATRVSSITVTSINDAPTGFAAGRLHLPSVPIGTASPAGVKVEDLVSAGIIDPDGDPLGIAVSGLTGTTNGQWQFSTDGTTWQNMGTVSATSALLLANSDFIRFAPNATFIGSAEIKFRAWDQTKGVAHARPALTSNLLTGSLSLEDFLAPVWVNTSPVLSAS